MPKEIIKKSPEMIVDGVAHGEVAQFLSSIETLEKHRTFSTLRKDDWELMDTAIIRVAEETLVGIADLRSRPALVRAIDGMGATLLGFTKMSDMGDASMAMSPDVTGIADRPDFAHGVLPLPVTFQDYYLNKREVTTSARAGMPLDTLSAEEASRAVSRKLETLLFKGDFKYGNGTVAGYTTFVDRNTYTISTSWKTASGEEIVADILKMTQMSIVDRHSGPWILYVCPNYASRLGEDYKATTSETILSRAKKIMGLEDIKTSYSLDDDEVVLVEMSTSTVKLIDGLPLSNIEWEPTSAAWQKLFKVVTIMVPQLMSDYDGRCGIVHGKK